MARKPVPTVLKKLRGSPRFRKSHDRREIHPASARHGTEIELTKLEQKIYDRKFAALSNLGVLTEADHDIFVFYIQAIAMLYTIQESLNDDATGGQNRELPDKHTFVMIRDLVAMVDRIGAEFGESPSARARLSSMGPMSPPPIKTIMLHNPDDNPLKGA